MGTPRKRRARQFSRILPYSSLQGAMTLSRLGKAQDQKMIRVWVVEPTLRALKKHSERKRGKLEKR